MAEVPMSLKVQYYRCFGELAAGFDTIKPINVLIGRNNSGKSALLDVVQAACNPRQTFTAQDSPSGRVATLLMSKSVSESEARVVFRENASSGEIRGNHWADAGRRYVGSTITWRSVSGANKDTRECLGVSVDVSNAYRSPVAKANFETGLARAMVNPLEGRLFRRLAAERNVLPEKDSADTDLQPDGRNVTNLIQRFYNFVEMDRAVIEKRLLDELNGIVAPDYRFDEVALRRYQDDRWEVFLREQQKGLIPLSASGSGLKTILCVLATMVLSPIASNRRDLQSYIFAFEELENNLHPALLRKILLYIAGQVKKQDSNVFLTTHSSAAIDLFAEDPDAQIVHTTHRPGGETKATAISEYLHRRDVLHDLDVRASDLLQSNGIIWVEGPSDRTYINHWIRLITDGGLKDGTHYQCVFYGGKLLAHLDADDPDHPDDNLLSVFRVNQNAAIVIDSDRATVDAEINRTKQRIVQEMQRMRAIAWVTAGREIENYLPPSAVAAASGLAAIPPLGRLSDLADHLDDIDNGAGRRFERNKYEFAAIAIEHIDLDNQGGVLDWRERMEELVEHVRRWNRIPNA